jgi:hypothetical protein
MVGVGLLPLPLLLLLLPPPKAITTNFAKALKRI